MEVVSNEKERRPQHEGTFKIFIATAFILVGLSLLFSAMGIYVFSMKYLWPLFMLIPVITLTLTFLKNPVKNVGVMIPIVILTYYCIFFLVCNYTEWYYIDIMWPNFIMAPGLAFVVMYYLTRKAEFLIPAGILILLAIIFFGTLFNSHLISGIAFIVIGLVIIFSYFAKMGKE